MNGPVLTAGVMLEAITAAAGLELNPSTPAQFWLIVHWILSWLTTSCAGSGVIVGGFVVQFIDTITAFPGAWGTIVGMKDSVITNANIEKIFKTILSHFSLV